MSQIIKINCIFVLRILYNLLIFSNRNRIFRTKMLVEFMNFYVNPFLYPVQYPWLTVD